MRTITLVTLALLLLCCLPTSVAQAQVAVVAPVNPTPMHQATPAPETGRTLIAWLDQPATLRAGQWAIFSGTPGPFGVQFLEMVSDTRCPAGVDCVQAGQVVIRLAFQLGGEPLPDEVELGTYTNDGQNKATYQGYEIELLDVMPPRPAPDETIAPEEYRATLLVRATGAAVTPQATPTSEPTPEPTAQATPISGPGKSLNAALGQPFLLRPGQTARLKAEDMSVTLRSLTDDSGCFSADDCSVMMAEGTLALQVGAAKELLNFNVSLRPEQPFVYEFGGYDVQLLHVEQNDDGDPVATFAVTGGQVAEIEVPELRPAKRCLGFSKFDAAAILQEEVNPQPLANLVFGPLAVDAPVLNGYCGYVSEAAPVDQTVDTTLPYLASAAAAEHAVVADRLEGEDALELLHLLALAGGSDAPAAGDTLPLLMTQMAAGLTDEVLTTLYERALANPAAEVEWLDGFDDEALWLTLPANHGQFVAAISRDGAAFNVVAALIGPEVSAADALGYGTAVLRKLSSQARKPGVFQVGGMTAPEDGHASNLKYNPERRDYFPTMRTSSPVIVTVST